MLQELSSNIFLGAIIEVSVFLFFQVLLFASPKRMAGMYLHILHLPRGVIGMLLVKLMPNSHDMLKEIRIPPSEKIAFTNISSTVLIGTQSCVDLFSAKCQKLLIIYTALTATTLILDLAAFIRCIVFYSSKLWKDAFADVSLLVLSAFFLTLDLFYFGWIFATCLKFPNFF